MTQGVPQGSFIGPVLWNILYDTVLGLELADGCMTIAYADDLALVIKDSSKYLLGGKGEICLEMIKAWMDENMLEMAPAKTEAILLEGIRKREDVCWKMCDTLILPKRSVKYLGLWLDDRMSFITHVRSVIGKAERSVRALNRILPNLEVPRELIRRVLCGVVDSIITYGAPVWAGVLRFGKYKNLLLTTQRKMLLRVAKAYRTVSDEALQVLTGIIPIDLQIRERP